MISMQRSLSSPVCVQTSPPESPPATRPTSRSPEVSPGPLDDDELPRTRRYRSRSPTKSTALFETHVSLPMRKANDASSQLGRQSPTKNASPIIVQKPIIEQTVLPAPYQELRKPRLDQPARETPPAAISTAPTMAPQPLLADLSLYRNTNINLEQDGTTLVELAHFVQLAKHQERKRASTRVRLQRSLISSALSARLTKCGEITLRNLAECFRNDDKKGFASLFNAIHDVRSSCDEARSFAVLEPEMDSLRSPGGASGSANPDTPVGTFGAMPAGQSVVPFLNDISASAREAFLNFLTQLRTNPDYLASRLSSLTATEIQSLTFFHKGLEPIEPVLPSYNRPGARGNAGTGNRGPSNQLNAVERLLSFQRHDPLSALIYTCFANSAGPDSAEDRRRTDVWAAACARLVQNKVHHSVLTSVLNVWSTMRDWAGRSNMELYLMKILEDGAFLLDRAEDPNGTRFNLSTWTNKDNAAMEEFYDNAVDGLFEILDDEDATGIPDGVIELGNAILRRVDNKLVDEVRRWLVYQWLFTNWLFAVVIHPESYGMMAEYHITEYGRQKVLKQVAHRAQKPVLDMLMSYKAKPDPVSPKIQGHIQNILGRFRPSRTAKTARLLPARSITSLRETAEVHPYLVISPADLLTLVNALFPERRPQSSYMSSMRSGAPSLSGFSAISQPVSIGTARSNNFDTASIASFSASSVLSDATTSRDFDQHNAGSPQRYSPPFTADLASQRPSANYEDDGYRLRLAMHEMVQTLGAETVAGSCHPCAERWAVLFISANGSNLSLQMTYDPDEDVDEENSSTTSETEDDELDSRPELDNDYHLLRDSILKLVEDFDIPRDLADDGSRTTLSNRASGLKRYKSKTRVVIPESSMGSRNPYRPRGSQDNLSSIKSPSPTAEDAEDELASQPVLIKMLIAASSQSRVQSDFVGAHLYWRTLQQLNALGSSSLRKNGFAALLNIFARGPRDSIRRSASATEEYDAWLIWLKQSQERHEGLLDTMMKRLRGIRDKMWYKTDVHNSQPYEDIRCHCTALKIMGVPSKWDSYKRNRAQMSRGLSANFLYQNESQTLDLLAAAEEQGGPNKLRDDQADKTSRWLEQFGIENFCRGEERIHRFCCEVDTCISKLVAEQVMDSPVLWSSELFTRDRGVFGGPRIARERESYYIDDDVISVVSGHGRRYTSSSTRAGSVARDLRSVTSFNLSQVSVDSSRHSYPRHSAAMSDILDAHEYFGVASPVHSIDPTTTYWSPFQSTMPSAASAMSTTSRAHSPTTSITNLSSAFSHPFSSAGSAHQANARPGTAASSNETVHQQRISDEKQQFLTDLRQTLTSLLLSDLGNLVFSRGSETDSWFNDLGQKCIDRDEAQEARSQRKTPRTDRSSRSSLKQRVIEKKKSFGDLRGAGESAAESTCSDRVDAVTSHGSDSVKPEVHSQSSPKPRSTAAKDGTADFPYKKAYQRLFRMFCVHPNPQVKLNALFELKNLVEASLLTSGRKNKWARQQRLAATDSHADHGSSQKVLEQTIDSIKERRSHASQPITAHPWSSRFISASDAKSIMSVAAAPNSDAVANMLLSLFKDSQVRPRTLFRDLQFISSFVSPSVLDKSEKGRAFWDAGLAALTLKQDVCRNMVNTAYDIIDMDQQLSRKPAASSAAAAPGSKEDKLGAQSGGRYGSLTPRDAARMYSITAKEGDPMAQRELALLILSRHELVVDRATLPLAKPRDVFKQAVMDNFGGGGSGAGRSSGGSTARHVSERVRSTFSASSGSGAGGGAGSNSSNASSSSASGLGGGSGGQDAGSIGDVRPDPSLMCVAFHWMETAAQGGDAQAKQFLVDNDMRRD